MPIAYMHSYVLILYFTEFYVRAAVTLCCQHGHVSYLFMRVNLFRYRFIQMRFINILLLNLYRPTYS